MLFNFKSFLILALPLATLGGVVDSRDQPRHFQELSKRVPGEVDLHKRFDNTRWTFFDVGLGACGKVSKPSDFVVALNAAQFGSGFPGPNCFRKIKMTHKGKTTHATIVDKCPGCPFGGLDLSRGLFRFFAKESVGVITGKWNFVTSKDGLLEATEE